MKHLFEVVELLNQEIKDEINNKGTNIDDHMYWYHRGRLELAKELKDKLNK